MKREAGKGQGNGRKKETEAPPALEEIRKGVNRLRNKLLQLERSALMSESLDERRKSLAQIIGIAQRLETEIEVAKKELVKTKVDREHRHSLLREMLLRQFPEFRVKAELAKVEAADRTLEAPQALVEGLQSGKDACVFALERLTSAADEEVRNSAFDALKDNPVAVKLACLESPHPDIRKRARALLKSGINAHFTSYVPKGDENYLELPLFHKYSKGT
jgi:hypothetical protein